MSTRDEILKRVFELGIVPVIAINDVEKAIPLAKALCKGGLPAAEITFRTDCAAEAITRIRKEVPEMLVGAGTVLTKDQVDGAIAAGSQFIVSPGFNPEIVKYALEKGAVMMPGTATPGEMEQAMTLGLDVVKFFPAEQNGGIAKLKAVSAPYSKLRFMPTGGINAQNLVDYIKFPKILACGGTWMVKKELIDAENWDEITRLTEEAVKTMLGLEFVHMGINCENEAEALKAAELFKAMFGFNYQNGNSSVFTMNKCVELCKTPKPGKFGHIGISTNSLERAAAYFKSKGFELLDESTVPQGMVYFKDEILGFAIHLVQKK